MHLSSILRSDIFDVPLGSRDIEAAHMHRVPAVSEGVVRVVKEAGGTGGIASHKHLRSRCGERAHADFKHNVRYA